MIEYFRLNKLDYKFHVLPDVFIVHWNHAPTQWSVHKPGKYYKQQQFIIFDVRRRWRTYFATIAELEPKMRTGEKDYDAH